MLPEHSRVAFRPSYRHLPSREGVSQSPLASWARASRAREWQWQLLSLFPSDDRSGSRPSGADARRRTSLTRGVTCTAIEGRRLCARARAKTLPNRLT